MSVRSKVLLIVTLVVALYGGVDYAVQRWVVYPSFVALERHEAVQDITRCVEALEREIHHLDTLCHDWAAWDDTYEFVFEPNDAYREANFVPTVLSQAGLNALYVVSADGRVIWGRTTDLNAEEDIPLKELPTDHWPADHPLRQHDFARGPLNDVVIKGVMITERGPMRVASRPILTSNNEGPPRGTFVMGRFLDAAAVARLAEQTRVALTVTTKDEASSPEQRAAIARITPQAPYHLHEVNEQTLGMYTTFPDIAGTTALLLQADIPRDITARGRAAQRFAVTSICAVGLGILLALLILLDRTVVGPIARLTAHAVRIGRTDDLTGRLAIKRSDEIGTLAGEFDQMVGRLADARSKLLEQSYRSGVAEMASETLHNVRNALTPLLVDMDLLRSELAAVPLDRIEQAKAELDDDSLPPERREGLTRYLDMAGTRLTSVTRQTQHKLERAVSHAKQVEQLLTNQESVSRSERPLEPVALHVLVHEALDSVSAGLRERITLEVDPGLADLSPIKTHRTSVRQVLTNLLANAAESIAQAGQARGTVRVRGYREEVDGLGMAHLEVMDQGRGFAPEELERVFARSESANDSLGQGLHWCANSLAALGGRIYAESDGAGRGARFHVLLPAGQEPVSPSGGQAF